MAFELDGAFNERSAEDDPPCSQGSPPLKYADKTGITDMNMDNPRQMIGSTDPAPNPHVRDRWGYQSVGQCYTQAVPYGTTDRKRVHRCARDLNGCTGSTYACEPDWVSCYSGPPAPPLSPGLFDGASERSILGAERRSFNDETYEDHDSYILEGGRKQYKEQKPAPGANLVSQAGTLAAAPMLLSSWAESVRARVKSDPRFANVDDSTLLRGLAALAAAAAAGCLVATGVVVRYRRQLRGLRGGQALLHLVQNGAKPLLGHLHMAHPSLLGGMARSRASRTTALVGRVSRWTS